MKTNKDNIDNRLPVKKKSEDEMLQKMIKKDLIKRIQKEADEKDATFMKVCKSIIRNSD